MGATPHVDDLYYDMDDVADRMETVLGKRPTANQLWKAARVSERPVRPGRMRLTAGMPASVEDDTRVLKWQAAAIETWLATHPLLALERARTELATALSEPDLLEPASPAAKGSRIVPKQAAVVAVARARAQGLSWGMIADVIGQVQGRPIGRQSVINTYG